MDQLYEILKSVEFKVYEADYAKVGDYWRDIVFFFRKSRFYYITEGEADMVLRDRILHLQPNHLYYIPSNSVVTANCSTILGHYFIHFEPESSIKNLLYFLQLKNSIPSRDGDIELFRAMTERIVPARRKSAIDNLESNGIMQILCSRFMDISKFKEDNFLRFSNTLQYIEHNIDKKITVRELAQNANLNNVYFSNLFTKSIGVSPSQYIISQKLQHAANALVTTDDSVKEISYRFGFSDELYFSRLFKLKNGFSPTELRKSLVGSTDTN